MIHDSLSPYAALLTPPAQLTVLEISPTSFTVSWMPPLGEFGNGSISYYFISVTDAEEESMVLLQDEVNETTLQLRVAELLPGSVHLVSVAAVSGEDIGPARTVWIKTNQLASMHCVEVCIIYIQCKLQYTPLIYIQCKLHK